MFTKQKHKEQDALNTLREYFAHFGLKIKKKLPLEFLMI